MDQSGLQQRDLIPFIGSRNRVHEVLKPPAIAALNMIRRLHEGLGLKRQPGGVALADFRSRGGNTIPGTSPSANL
jgi:hypothetical protein